MREISRKKKKVLIPVIGQVKGEVKNKFQEANYEEFVGRSLLY